MKIVIEGNVGAGKTTVASKLAKMYGFQLLEEPVAENPYLERFYSDRPRYSLEMQFWLLSKRYMQDEDAFRYIVRTGRGTIQDRSLRGDKVFAYANYLLGYIDELGYYSYRNLHDAMVRRLPPNNVIIYLDVRPEICLHRVAKRDRKCETDQNKKEFLSYLHLLDDGYRKEITAMEAEGTTVFRIDWSNTDDITLITRRLEQDDRFDVFWRGFKCTQKGD